MEHPIQEITQNTISDMIRRISSLEFSYFDPPRCSSLVYEEIRINILEYLENVLKQLVPLKKFQKNNNVTEQDVLQMLHFVPGMIPRLNHCSVNKLKKPSYKIMTEYKKTSKKYTELKKQYDQLMIKYRENTDDTKLIDQINTLDDKMMDLRERKDELYDNYIVPAREKRDELKRKLEIEDTCFYIFPKSFRRLLDYIARDYSFTFTDDAYLLIQFDVEYYIQKIIKNGIRAVHHAKRETIMPRDLQIGKSTMREYEKIIFRPRFVFPEMNVSYKKEYIKIRDLMGIEEKTVNDKLISQLDLFNHLLIELLIEYAHVYNSMEKKSKITKRNLQIAVDSIFPGELAKHAQSEGRKTERNNSKVSFNIQTGFNLEPDAIIFLNTVIEYINAEFIGLMNGLHSSSEFCIVLENDDELNNLKNHLGFVPIKIT